MTPLFAHYGGIDEIGVFVVPALIAIWALKTAEKRAKRRADQRALEEHDDS